MGIWQAFLLTSVLMLPVFSIYPNLGNPHVRKDLHTLILPRQEQSTTIRHLMQSTTQEDMHPRHWLPDHFVAAFPSTNVPKGGKHKDDEKTHSNSRNINDYLEEIKPTDTKTFSNVEAESENLDRNNNNTTGLDDWKGKQYCVRQSERK